MKSRGIRFSIFLFFLFIYGPFCVGEALFEDDFEKKAIDKGKWVPTGTWSVVGHSFAVDPEDALPVTWGELKRVR